MVVNRQVSLAVSLVPGSAQSLRVRLCTHKLHHVATCLHTVRQVLLTRTDRIDVHHTEAARLNVSTQDFRQVLFVVLVDCRRSLEV